MSQIVLLRVYAVNNKEWTTLLTKLTDTDLDRDFVPISLALIQLESEQDYCLIDYVLETYHPRYISGTAMVILLDTTSRFRNRLKHWESFLLKAIEEIQLRCQRYNVN